MLSISVGAQAKSYSTGHVAGSAVSGGGVGWTKTDQTYVMDSSSASWLGTKQSSLTITGFLPNVPASATVTGITININGRAAATSGTNEMYRLTLSTNAGATANGTRLTGLAFTTAYSSRSWPSGGAGISLWGGTWTVTDVNANLGVILQDDDASSSALGWDFVTSSVSYAFAPVTPYAQAVYLSSITVSWTLPGPPRSSAGYIVQASSALASNFFWGTIYSSSTVQTTLSTISVVSVTPQLSSNTVYNIRAGALWGDATAYAAIFTTATLANIVVNPQVMGVFITSVTANWLPRPAAPLADSCSGYVLEASTAANFSGTIYSSATTQGVTVSTLTLVNLSTSTVYYLRYGTLNNTYYVPNYYSTGAVVTTLTAPPLTPAASDAELSSITVTWTQIDARKGYIIEASTAADFTGTLYSSSTVQTTLSTLTILSPQLSSNTIYNIRIGSLWGNATGYADAIATATLSNLVLNPVAPGVFISSITANWLPRPAAPLADSCSGYVLEASTAADFSGTVYSSVTLQGVVVTTLTVEGLSGATPYYLRFGTLNNTYYQPNYYSTGTVVTTKIPPPEDTAVSAVYLSSMAVAWTPVGSTKGYIVQASTAANFTGTLYSSSTAQQLSALSVGALSPQLSSNTVYNIRVGSLWGNATAYADGISTATLSNIVANPQVYTVNKTSVTANWLPRPAAPLSDACSGYVLEASTAADFSGDVYSSVTLQGVAVTTLTVEGLSFATPYYLRYGTLNTVYYQPNYYSTGAVVVTLAPPPLNSAAPSVYLSSIAVTWTPVTSLNGYIVQASTAADFTGTLYSSSTVLELSGLSIGAVAPQLSSNTVYNIRVGSLWGNSTDYAASFATATLANLVVNPQIAGVFITSVTANWLPRPAAPLANACSGYVLEASPNPDFSAPVYSSVTTQGVAVTTLSVVGLSTSTVYYLRYGALNSNYFVPNYYSTGTQVATLPYPVPGGASASAVYLSSIAVAWTPVGSTAGYLVEASTAADFTGTLYSSSTLQHLSGLSVGAIAPQLSSNTVYNIRVGSLWGSATIYANAIATATLSNMVVNPVVYGVFVTSITANWLPRPAAPLEDSCSGYVLEASPNSDFSPPVYSSVAINGVDLSTLTVEGLEASTVYYLRYGALNNAYYQPNYYSTGAVVTTLLPPPDNPAVSAVYLSSMAVTWTTVSSLKGYIVQASTAVNFTGTLYSSSTVLQLSSLKVGVVSPQLSSNTVYNIRVGSLWGNSTMYAEAIATATLSNIVVNPRVYGVFSTSVTVNWLPRPVSPLANSCSGYVLEASTAPNFSGDVYSSATLQGVAVTTLTVEGLAGLDTYYLRYGTLNNTYFQPNYYSTGAVVTTTRPAPEDSAIPSVYLSSIAVTWTTVASLKGYIVQASTAANFTGTLYSSSTVLQLSGLKIGVVSPQLSSNTVYNIRTGSLWGNATVYADAIATATLSNIVVNPKIYGVFTTSVTANWSARPATPLANACSGYILEASTAANFTGDIYSSATFKGVALTTLTLTGLSELTTYYFRYGTLNNAYFVPNYYSTGTVIRTLLSPVVINEVYPAGAVLADDWVELYNTSKTTYTLTNWTLDYYQCAIADNCAPTTTAWTGGAPDKINALSTFTIIPSAPPGGFNSGFSWYVALKDNAGGLVNRVQWPDTMTSGQSFARISDGNTYYFEIDPTPTKGYANYLATDTLKINEAAYGSLGSQFIELYNTNNVSSKTLRGYALRNSYGVDFRFTRFISSMNYTVLDYSSISDDGYTWEQAFGPGGLKAAGDFLALGNSTGTTVDKFTWESGPGTYSRYSSTGVLVTIMDIAPANAVYSVGRSTGGKDTDSNSVDFKAMPFTTLCSSNAKAGLASTNTFTSPAEGQILSRAFPIRIKFGANSSSGTANNLVFQWTGGQPDNFSPHIYRLQDEGFLLGTTLSTQTTVQMGLSFTDQDGHVLVDSATYRVTLNTQNGATTAPQIIRGTVTYDGAMHTVSYYADASPPRLPDATRASALRFDVSNNSRVGFNSVEIGTVTFKVLDSNLAVTAFTQANARNSFDAIMIVRESTSGLQGEYEPFIDVSTIAYVPKASITLDAANGRSTMTVNLPISPNAFVAAGSTQTFYVVFESTRFASAYSTNTFRVRFSPQTDIVIGDAPSDTVQNLPAYSQLDTSSTTIIAVASAPAGTQWPYVSPSSAPVNALTLFYDNYNNETSVSSTVYVGASDGIVRAVYSTGTIKWIYSTFSPVSAISASGSAQVEGGFVYVYFATDNGDMYKIKDNNSAAALEWKSALGSQIRSNPMISGSKIYVGMADNKVRCLNIADGSACAGWSFHSGIDAPISGTISIDNRGSVNTGWIGLENGKVVSVNTISGEAATSLPAGSTEIKSSPYLHFITNNLYVASTGGSLYARQAANLTLLPGGWSDFDTGGSAIYTSPFISWSMVDALPLYAYVGADNGKLYKIDANAGGAEVWAFQAGAAVRSSPIWVPGSFVNLAADYVYFGSDDGYIYAIDADTGQLRPNWPVATGGAVRSDPVVNIVTDDLGNFVRATLIIGSTDGRTYVLNIGP